MLSRMNGVYAQVGESVLLEQHAILDRIRSPEILAHRLLELIKVEATEEAAWLRLELLDRARQIPRPTTTQIYVGAMNALAKHLGQRRWAQKATSYIFYAREILELIPDAQLLYMLRNPWDIVASRQRRDPGTEAVLSTMLGWNRGIRLANELRDAYPDRFRIVRYEDLTGKTEQTVEQLCHWLGEPFDHALLDVPHVNPAENKYALTSETRGINMSKTFTYHELLSKPDIAAVDLLVKRYRLNDALDRWYPDLPHALGESTRQNIRKAKWKLRLAPGRYAWHYTTAIKRSPAHLLARTLRRMQ